MAWQEARDGGADDGVRAKDHLLFSVKSRRSKRAQVELFPAWAVKPLFSTTIKARAWQFRVAGKRRSRCCAHITLISTATVGSRIAASEKSLPTLFGGVVSLMLIDQFAMSRTKARVHPPAAIPKISGTDT